jgi:hypothetical protein
MPLHRAATLGLLLGVLFAAGPAPAADWKPTEWNGEPAWASQSEGWRAVVSTARARLMHFGPENSEINLLLAPASRENRNRLGGHRLWLGPQTGWKDFWPPPDAWEYREPQGLSNGQGELRLVMAKTPDDWPWLVRTYHWDGPRLVCGAEFVGGARPAQFIHILQVPAETVVRATVRPEEGYPAGYVRLLSTAGPFTARFVPPPHAALAGDELSLRHTGAVGKYGFRPQPLVGRLGDYELTVSRGAQKGVVVGEPDEGFHAQVYLSDSQGPFAEIEQLSPLFAPDQHARFEMVLSGRKR